MFRKLRFCGVLKLRAKKIKIQKLDAITMEKDRKNSNSRKGRISIVIVPNKKIKESLFLLVLNENFKMKYTETIYIKKASAWKIMSFISVGLTPKINNRGLNPEIVRKKLLIEKTTNFLLNRTKNKRTNTKGEVRGISKCNINKHMAVFA
ncbi:MAG: hypothetical protein ACK5P5_12660 [Pseudobdellovibrionaceae bacterium]